MHHQASEQQFGGAMPAMEQPTPVAAEPTLEHSRLVRWGIVAAAAALAVTAALAFGGHHTGTPSPSVNFSWDGKNAG